MDDLEEIMPRGDVPVSEHLALEIEAAHERGRPLEPGEPVPGCECPRCVGLPLGWDESEVAG